MLRSYRLKFGTYLRILLILGVSACQTLKKSSEDDKKADDILNTQKSLVINYINQGQPNMALREIRPLEKQYPKDADLKNLTGLIYLSTQNSKAALNYFEQAYHLDPRAPIALNLSSALIESGQSVRAIKVLKDLKASPAGKAYQYPERIDHNIGLAAERMKKLDIAEKYYKRALATNPYYYISLMRLGTLYQSEKKAGSAYTQFSKAHESCLKCFEPVQAMVQMQAGAGKTAYASKLIQEYLIDKELEPRDRAKAQQLLSWSQNQNHSQAQGSTKPTSVRTQ
ncbi:MAG: tetratricopeptide repeat protein [Chitinophagaceae bacterium]|nr:tetratricopeptide repeat protein [Oligoflexus sp.]